MTTPQTHSVDLKFSPSDIDRILTSTFIQHIEYCDELASTNTRECSWLRTLPKTTPVCWC